MTLEDHDLLKIAIGNLIICGDCRFYKAGICTRLNSTNVECDNRMLICDDADGCTFGVIRKDEEQ